MYLIIVLSTIALCAWLWRLGGNGHGLARNPGVPIVLGVVKLALLCLFTWPLCWWNFLALAYIPALWGMIQALSYGVDTPPHKFWVWVFGQGETGNYPPVEIATRCTCGFFWSLPAIIFAFLSGGWILFGIYVLFLTIMNGLIWYFIQNVNINEKAVGTCVATSLII